LFEVVDFEILREVEMMKVAMWMIDKKKRRDFLTDNG